MPSSSLRAIDANANRAREALRVMEDVARFALDDRPLCADLKSLRHTLAASLAPLERAGSIEHRDTPGDVGTDVKTTSEMQRADVEAVAVAAGKRLAESLRSIEEFAKTLDAHPPSPREGPGASERPDTTARAPTLPAAIEGLRYRAYDLDRRLILALRSGGAPIRTPRLCVLLTSGLCEHHAWLDVARRAIEAGADSIQLREKELEGGELLRRVRLLVQVARDAAQAGGRRATIIVNDRPDVALLGEADGVHLGQGDIPCVAARALFDRASRRRLIVGVSTSRMEQAERADADGADYCGVGPMFPSQTKPKERLAGPEYLRAYLDRGASLPPPVAISGVTPDTLPSLVEAVGGRSFGIAVSSCVCAAADPASVVRRLLEGLPRSPERDGADDR